MASQPVPPLDDGFLLPGLIRISPSAFQLARDLAYTVRNMQGGGWVIVFDWATNVSLKSGPDATPQPIADCVMVGASKRHEVPQASIQTMDDVAFAIQIPEHIWKNAEERLIDRDESLPFKLVLR